MCLRSRNVCLEKSVMVGQPIWHVPSAEQDQDGDGRSEDWDLGHLYGAQKHFRLSYPKPVECRSSSEPGFVHYGSSDVPDARLTSSHPRAILLLTLCWSYILSARLWELQGKTLSYSEHALQPQLAKTVPFQHDYFQLRLGRFASHDLVKWLCAILAPKPGFSVEGGGFTPWTAVCSGDVRFVISTDELVTFASNERAPGSDRAAELLMDLCSLYGLGPSNHHSKVSEPLPPYTAAFLAALAPPFYRDLDLQPQFPMPKTLRRRSINRETLGPIRQYVTDLPYYMTLSMHPTAIGSVIWRIFWQPEVQCNVVSPWLSSVLGVLRPIIDSGDLEMMAKVFAFRRPRVALWWLGIFICGNRDILNWISRYLETLEERYGYGSMAPPDTTVSAWTGSPQSFLDDETSRVYTHSKDFVPRADLLRHRYNLHLQDTASTPLSWRPFGVVPKDAVEPYLWPWLEHGHAREYVHWVWWIKDTRGAVRRDIQNGFRKDTGRFVSGVPDRLAMKQVGESAKCSEPIQLEPSLPSTLRMLHYCMEDAIGDRDGEISTVPGAREHRWLKHWRGLE